MIKKILMGFVWWVVFYFLTCAVIGGIAGAMAGAADPQNASEAGRLAGEKLVSAYILFIFGGSFLAAAVGSATGFLPGTKGKSKQPKEP